MLMLLMAALLQAAIPMKPIDRGTQSGIMEPRQVVVRTADEWTSLWRTHAPTRPQPPVEFPNEMVVGVFLGSRPTGGFRVEIVSVRQEDGALVVTYKETRPGRGSITAQVLTTPFVLVSIPSHAGEVRFEEAKTP